VPITVGTMPISTIPSKLLNKGVNYRTSRFEVIPERESLVERYLGKVEVKGSNPDGLIANYSVWKF
jgi:hypothetical protein